MKIIDKTYKIKEFFEPKLGINIQNAELCSTGEIPVITGITESNGINGYVNKEINNYTYENRITISNRGAKSGTAYYHNYKFILGSNVILFEPIDDLKLNVYHNLYLTAVFNKLPYTGYNNYPTKTSISEDIIQLPTSDGVNPDWDYMEKYIKEIKDKYTKKLKNQNDKWIKDACKIVGLDAGEILNPKEKDETGVKIPELKYETGELPSHVLFDMTSSTAKKKNIIKIQEPTEHCNTFGLSATVDNRGFGYYVSNSDFDIVKTPCLTVSANGANTGKVYAQINDFAVVQDSYALHLKEKWGVQNTAAYLYLETALEKTNQLFDYNNKAGWARVQHNKIILPIDKNGDPDFDMMSKITHTHTKKFIENKHLSNREKVKLIKKIL